jgi:hypothetical protein
VRIEPDGSIRKGSGLKVAQPPKAGAPRGQRLSITRSTPLIYKGVRG